MKTQRTKRPPARARPRTRAQPRSQNANLTIIRGPRVMPPRFRTMMHYQTSARINQVGFINANVRYQPTNLNNIDFSGSTNVPYFTGLAAAYRNYRVNRFRTKISCSNAEAFSVQFYTCPDNVDPGVNTANFQTFLSNREANRRFLGPLTGNGITTMSLPFASVGAFAGSALHTRIVDQYTGAVTGGPTNNIFLIVGVKSGSAVLANGVDMELDLDLEVDFSELQNPTN